MNATDAINTFGCVIATEDVVATQNFASLTVTEYVPAAKPIIGLLEEKVVPLVE